MKFLIYLNLGITSLITMLFLSMTILMFIVFLRGSPLVDDRTIHFFGSPIWINVFLLVFGGIFIMIKQLSNLKKFQIYFLLYYTGVSMLPVTWIMTLVAGYFND